MAGKLPGNPSKNTTSKETPYIHMPKELQCLACKWYFSKQEIEDLSPSRKDGIDNEVESELRKLYCSFLRELGMELGVPQVTIAAAMMLCHRFYMSQSHAKNDWQTIATVSMFLACKFEETPRYLSDVAFVAYTLLYRWDPSARRRIRQGDVLNKQKGLILIGERLLLTTMAFDLNVGLPYKPLVAALRRLEISKMDIEKLAKAAWNFLNDWLCTSLSLQYTPHYIAAGSMFLAAKFQKVKLPKEKGKEWWMQFDVSPKQLEEVIQQMIELLKKNQKQALLPPMQGKEIESKPALVKAIPNILESAIRSGSNVAQYIGQGATVDAGGFVKSATPNTPQSYVFRGSNVADCIGHGAMVDSRGLAKSVMYKCSENEASRDFHVSMEESFCCQISDCGSANSNVEDGDGETEMGKLEQNSSSKIVSVQGGNMKTCMTRISEGLKRRTGDSVVKEMLVKDSKAWMEREMETISIDKRRRV